MNVLQPPYAEIQKVADQAAALLSDLPTLRQDMDDEGLDSNFLQATVEAWAGLLADNYIHEAYAREYGVERPEGFASFGRAPLPDIASCLNEIRQAFGEKDAGRVSQAVIQLSVFFLHLTSSLSERPDLSLSAQLQELIARYQFIDKIRTADSLKSKAEELLASTERSAVKASEAATSATKAAGTTGESVMASYFKDFAQEEWESATRFRVWTIVLLALGGGLAAVFLLLPAFGVAALALDAGDYVHLVQRVIVTAAVFALAAYLARQSHQHRTLANWARALSVQLKTFEAFMAPLDSSEAKQLLRAQFAARVFGEPPVLRGDTPSGDSSSVPVPDKLWDFLSRGFGKSE